VSHDVRAFFKFDVGCSVDLKPLSEIVFEFEVGLKLYSHLIIFYKECLYSYDLLYFSGVIGNI